MKMKLESSLQKNDIVILTFKSHEKGSIVRVDYDAELRRKMRYMRRLRHFKENVWFLGVDRGMSALMRWESVYIEDQSHYIRSGCTTEVVVVHAHDLERTMAIFKRHKGDMATTTYANQTQTT
jgi:hypothetical protein